MQFFREDFEILVSLKNKAVSFKVELHKDWYGKEFWSKVSNETYEPDTIKFVENFCDKSTDFVDIGAANGAFSLIAFSLGARVYAFEPNPVMYEVAKRNFSINFKKNKMLRIENKAVSSESGEIEFKIDHAPSILSDIVFTGMEMCKSSRISVVSLSEVLNEIHKDLNRNVVVKMDIEGAEWKILKSKLSLNALRTHGVVLLLAIHPGFHRPFKKTVRGLDAINLRIFKLKNFLDSLKLFGDLHGVAKVFRTNFNPITNKLNFAGLAHHGYHEFIIDFSSDSK